MTGILICPICKDKLNKLAQAYVCASSHTFDMSSYGYTNLLLVNQRSSKNPGESDSMIDARRAFLEKGYYDEIPNTLAKIIGDYAKQLGKDYLKILDVGCGEGYYLNKINNSLQSELLKTETHGLDITKYAIQLGAKKYKNSTFFVSNINYEFPIADASLDVILNIFAPRNPSEFARILKEAGLLIVVLPGVNHLIKLRSLLDYHISYEEKVESVTELLRPNFKVINHLSINYQLSLNKEDVQLLAMMTPIYWQVSQYKVADLTPIENETVEFEILVLGKPDRNY